MPTAITTIELLAEKLPKEYKPVVLEYGPVLLKMSTESLWSWIDLMARGNTSEAYRTLVMGMSSTDVIAELDNLNLEWKKDNKKNAQRMNLQRDASFAILSVALKMALTLVGL